MRSVQLFVARLGLLGAAVGFALVAHTAVGIYVVNLDMQRRLADGARSNAVTVQGCRILDPELYEEQLPPPTTGMTIIAVIAEQCEFCVAALDAWGSHLSRLPQAREATVLVATISGELDDSDEGMRPLRLIRTMSQRTVIARVKDPRSYQILTGVRHLPVVALAKGTDIVFLSVGLPSDTARNALTDRLSSPHLPLFAEFDIRNQRPQPGPVPAGYRVARP